MKLLLVEDDPTMQITLQRTLGRRRIDVRVCGDGAQAVTQWRAIEGLANKDGPFIYAATRSGLRSINLTFHV